MSNYYVACDFGMESGSIMLGTLEKNKLTVSEVRRFKNQPVQDKESLYWNIPELYQETMTALSDLSRYDEPVDSISCDSWDADYLLFEEDGALITPAYHHNDPRNEPGMEHVFSKIPWETIYAETGVNKLPTNTLFQLGAEKHKRLKKAQLMPVADGFNFLLAGVPSIELSLASTTQLYNPVTKAWSDSLIHALKLPPKLFPPVVSAGTQLGALRPDLAKATGLTEARIVSSCSHDIAAALAGLPIKPGEEWAFLRLGQTTIMGTEVKDPIITEVSRELNYTNALGYGGAVRFSKQVTGLWLLDECRKFWNDKDRDIDLDMLTHLTICSPPFESLINPADPRFQEPGDMPLKIQAFCRETGQTVPRKPGPITRCVLESLALLYRKTLQEIEYLSGREITQVYVLGGGGNALLNTFIANALQMPVIVAHESVTAIGNVIVQALAHGNLKSLDQARDVVRNSFTMETIVPHANAWEAAYDRLTQFFAPEVPAGKVPAKRA